MPGASKMSPVLKSEPARADEARRRRRARRSVTTSPSRCATSWMTTRSAPAGSGAPVKMRTASPALSARVDTRRPERTRRRSAAAPAGRPRAPHSRPSPTRRRPGASTRRQHRRGEHAPVPPRPAAPVPAPSGLRRRGEQRQRLVEADHGPDQSPDWPPLLAVTVMPSIVIVAVDRLQHVEQGQAGDRRRRSAPPSRPRSGRSSAPRRRPGSRAAPRPAAIVTATLVSGSGWQSGISSAVRLAAITPASSAVWITAPFGVVPSRTCASVSGGAAQQPLARWRARSVAGLSRDVDHPRAAVVVDMAEPAHAQLPPQPRHLAGERAGPVAAVELERRGPGPSRRGRRRSSRAGRR